MEILIKVKVFPGAKKEKVLNDNGVLQIFVRESAQRNMANNRVRQIIAESENISINNVQIRTGHRSFRKTLVIIK